MNKFIFQSFKKLSEIEKSTFVHRFKDSPTVVKFIDFIERSDSPNFKTLSAIDAVYGDEKNKTEFRILENRYFKLRKKVSDELKQTNKIDSSNLQAEEEQRFLTARHLISSENKELAYKQLVALEKECWEKNIFELLPSIIDQLIFCNQSFNRLENNKPIFARQKNAIELLHDMSILGMTARKIYEINFTKGIDYAGKDLAMIRKLAAKHKQYPRFLLCYYHVAAYYKLGSPKHAGESTISRQLSAYKKLQKKYPLIPLMQYKANYVQFQHLHFNQMMISYHFNRCEFDQAYLAMKEVWHLVVQENSIFKMYKSESLFYNMVTAQCMTQRYAEAFETTNDFISYLKANQQTDKLLVPNVLKAWIYADIYPATFKMNPSFLSDQLDEYIKVLKKSGNTMIPLDQTLVLKAKLLIIDKKFDKAHQLFKDPVVVSYLNALNLNSIFLNLISILENDPEDKKQKLTELFKALQGIRYKAKTASEYMNIHWLENHLKHLLKHY
jgi:hypothetical protein